MEYQIKGLLDGGSTIPKEPNSKAVEQWLIDAHRYYWETNVGEW